MIFLLATNTGDSDVGFILLMIALAIGLLALYIFLCRIAYLSGTNTGNQTVSIALIILGIASIGIVLPIALSHLIGTSKFKSNLEVKTEELVDLEKQKLLEELEYYKRKNNNEKN